MQNKVPRKIFSAARKIFSEPPKFFFAPPREASFPQASE